MEVVVSKNLIRKRIFLGDPKNDPANKTAAKETNQTEVGIDKGAEQNKGEEKEQEIKE